MSVALAVDRTMYGTWKNLNAGSVIAKSINFRSSASVLARSWNTLRFPLSDWFIAIWMCTNFKAGFSSHGLQRELGITQKSAWYMEHRIRDALKGRKRKLEGVVEIDECWIGGKYKWRTYMHWTRPTKQIVMGLLQRGGPVRMLVIPDRNRTTLHHVVKSHVLPGSTIITDDLACLSGIRKESKSPHLRGAKSVDSRERLNENKRQQAIT